MAEFSVEYCRKENLSFPGDFSVIEIFELLENGDVAEEICEGFGFTEIHRINDECWVLIRHEKVRFSELLENEKGD